MSVYRPVSKVGKLLPILFMINSQQFQGICCLSYIWLLFAITLSFVFSMCTYVLSINFIFSTWLLVVSDRAILQFPKNP